MQLQQSTAASLRVNWLGIFNVDVLPMADSEDKLGIAHHHHDSIVYSMRIKRSRACQRWHCCARLASNLRLCELWDLETGPW